LPPPPPTPNPQSQIPNPHEKNKIIKYYIIIKYNNNN